MSNKAKFTLGLCFLAKTLRSVHGLMVNPRDELVLVTLSFLTVYICETRRPTCLSSHLPFLVSDITILQYGKA